MVNNLHIRITGFSPDTESINKARLIQIKASLVLKVLLCKAFVYNFCTLRRETLYIKIMGPNTKKRLEPLKLMILLGYIMVWTSNFSQGNYTKL